MTDWLDQFIMGVVSNECAVFQTPTWYSYCMLWKTLLVANQEVHCAISTRQEDGDAAFIFARWADYDNHLFLMIVRDDGVGDTVECFERIAGADSSIGGPYPIVFQDGDSFGLQCANASIGIYHKPVAGAWTLLDIAITALIAGGKIGIGAYT